MSFYHHITSKILQVLQRPNLYHLITEKLKQTLELLDCRDFKKLNLVWLFDVRLESLITTAPAAQKYHPHLRSDQK